MARLTINMEHCRYPVVEEQALALGYARNDDDSRFSVFWSDLSVLEQRVRGLIPGQVLNHFPGMHVLSRKEEAAVLLGQLHAACPSAYDYSPRSWVLPAAASTFSSAVRRAAPDALFIVKPAASCQGRGISLVGKDKPFVPTREAGVAQDYIPAPLLIDGLKFDLRIYVIVRSVAPLVVVMYDEGLVRLCTTPYVASGADLTSHLTNYAINKDSDSFVAPDDATEGAGSHKRSLAWFRAWLLETRGAPARDAVMRSIDAVVLKTVIAAAPSLQHTLASCGTPLSASTAAADEAGAFSPCFEVLGFDVMFDEALKCWLIEVNHSPSFETASEMDARIKSRLVRDTLELLGQRPADAGVFSAEQAARTRARLRGGGRKSGKPDEGDDDPVEAIRRHRRGVYGDMLSRPFSMLRQLWPLPDSDPAKADLEDLLELSQGAFQKRQTSSRNRPRKQPKMAFGRPVRMTDFDPGLAAAAS